ncbi:proton channel OTOP3 isoform X2 [Cephus cinctus]|uniref:Proton channel OTOP3 isoform X2 n=1 Tax=Cephus cinctus TaxID=211228 RepID=A0AAJ7RG08_CEPCN|nr:proton channel OTOP3 isoform X2 [Cephus cinctus]
MILRSLDPHEPIILQAPGEPSSSTNGFERRDSHSVPRARSPSLKRQSISLNAVFNHRRALFGALLNGIGSNMSLPSCVPQQDQELPGPIAIGRRAIPISNLTRNNSIRSHDRKPRPSMLQLTPVNTAAVPLTTLETTKVSSPPDPPVPTHTRPRLKHHAELTSSLSSLYAKLLVVVGVAVPVTASVSHRVPAALDKGFYLYLYIVSVGFVITLYTTLMRDKAVKRLLVKHIKNRKSFKFEEEEVQSGTIRVQQYGSFCLRLGAVGFGAGSLVFTGLQIGAEIVSGPFRAIIPTARLLLVTAQMHFIFLNSKDFELAKHGALSKLGLMHMIATNLCEWLQALVEETRHEIAQLEHSHEGDDGIFRTLLRNASPFLFPCTIEFSLICAVILFEMWKRVDERVPINRDVPTRALHHLSIDCSSAHRGLFGGILVIAGTVLSLIMFFVLKDSKPMMAVKQVTALETAILIAALIASLRAAFMLKSLELKDIRPPQLDATLLAAAQAGVYLHCLFGAVGGILTTGPDWGLALTADLLTLIQSTIQTLVIKIGWRRRSRTNDKPGKELITFLIVVNLALWTVNTLEKSRAVVRPDHLQFFGVWAWTIITHVSIPLAIFFRFHSAICLFEVWKSCYKYRPSGLLNTPC